jgi:hypothetical protein
MDKGFFIVEDNWIFGEIDESGFFDTGERYKITFM